MRGATRPPWARWAVGLGTCAVAIAGAAVAVRAGGHSGTAEPAPSATTVASSTTIEPQAGGDADQGSAAGPRGVEDDTDAGAVDAAIAFAAAPQRWLYLDDEELADAVAEVASPQAAETLTAEMVSDVRAARDELAQSSSRVWWLVHPLAWRLDSSIDGEATVAVWVVTMLSAADVAMPQTEWYTVLVDLVWADGRWLVDGFNERPGPTPMTGPQDQPWEPEPFDAALDGFTRLDGEPVR